MLVAIHCDRGPTPTTIARSMDNLRLRLLALKFRILTDRTLGYSSQRRPLRQPPVRHISLLRTHYYLLYALLSLTARFGFVEVGFRPQMSIMGRHYENRTAAAKRQRDESRCPLKGRGDRTKPLGIPAGGNSETSACRSQQVRKPGKSRAAITPAVVCLLCLT